jgi:hypothetical protein
MRQISLITVSLVMAVNLIAGLTGCGDAAGEARTEAPVILTIRGLNGGAPLQASVGSLLEDEVSVEVGVQAINPNMDSTSFYMDVMVKGYEVSYRRKDTGTRVPATFTGNTTTYCGVDGNAQFSAVVCRASQKEMPPLRDLCQFGYDTETGLMEIHTQCQLIVWGETFAGERVVSKPASFTVNFACQWEQQ